MRPLVVGFAMALLLCACAAADMSGSLPDRVRAWSSGADLRGTESTLADDVRRIHLAIGQNDPIVLKTECAAFIADVRTAIGNLPSPDTELTDYLNRAYNAYAQAASDCYEGASSSDRGKVASAVHQLNVGDGYMHGAESRVATITGR